MEGSEISKGRWTPEEDERLKRYIEIHKPRNWMNVPKLAGLNRTGRSCRARWCNYLSPDVKHGNFSPEEEHQIIKLYFTHQRALGRPTWSEIASKLPGRTGNKIRNYWKTHLRKWSYHGDGIRHPSPSQYHHPSMSQPMTILKRNEGAESLAPFFADANEKLDLERINDPSFMNFNDLSSMGFLEGPQAQASFSTATAGEKFANVDWIDEWNISGGNGGRQAPASSFTVAGDEEINSMINELWAKDGDLHFDDDGE